MARVTHNRNQTRSPDVEGQQTPAVRDERQEPHTENTTPERDDLVTEGQTNDPATPEALDKDGPADEIAAPGEAKAGEEIVKVRATGDFLVYDPYTLDSVDREGGEMRLTAFVREKLDEKKLEKF